MNHPEREHQTAFFQWLRMNELRFPFLAFFFAIPNGGLRDRAVAVGLFKEGVKRGVLDTFLPVPRNGFHGLWIEFKAGKNVLSSEQATWKAFLEARSYAVHVVYNWIDAARITVKYLDLKMEPPK